MSQPLSDLKLTDRQRRELEYHKQHAAKHGHGHIAERVRFDSLDPQQTRWWNDHWEMYRNLRTMDLRGRNALVIGCGFGHDALRLAKLSTHVDAFDLSNEELNVARALAHQEGLEINFRQMPAECMDYPDAQFDVVFVKGILHHCEINQVMAEVRRVCKPGALCIINEPYTHSALQRIRESRFVSKVIYPRLRSFIYSGQPYITQDERKLNERDLAMLQHSFTLASTQYFYGFVGRVVPQRITAFTKLDRILLWAVGPLGRLLAGRFVIMGHLA